MDIQTTLSQKDLLLKANPEVLDYSATFKTLNRSWSGAITAGMIETGRMATDAAKLFTPLVEDMKGTKAKYEQTQEKLLDGILLEMLKKVVFEVTDTAKFAINILKRNLFERTADVGYLATDSEIVEFIKNNTGQDTVPTEERERIRKRLTEYQYEYTVYNEILILDTGGRVLGNLDPENRIEFSRDPILEKAQAIDLHNTHTGDLFVETYGKTDLRPGKEDALIYAQKIEDPDTHEPLGVLCLCFDFKDEMCGIFKDLGEGNDKMIVALLDDGGKIISSNCPAVIPEGHKVKIDLETDFLFLNFNGKTFLANMAATDGYQGFYGLPWYGLAMIDCQAAFQAEKLNGALQAAATENLENFSTELAVIKKESDDLLADMKIDSLNGQVQAAKFNANSFVAVLHFVKMIGEDLNNLFSSAIGNLQDTVVSSLFNEVQFRAFQGNNIMDRNLYERANDVCWWALTPLFRKLMKKHMEKELEEADKAALTQNLQYINNLYTPYLRLLLVDTKGCVVAVSDPPEELEEKLVDKDLPTGQAFVGTYLDSELVEQAMRLPSSKDYCVSAFSPTPLYGGRPTYIYSTAVRHPENHERVVGTIQIVFDAQPQFLAMLTDTLPRDADKKIVSGALGVFVDRDKQIISSTDPEQFAIGSSLPLENRFFEYKKGERDSSVIELDGRSYAMGLQVSAGYREYKCKDGYENDIICMIFVPVSS